ncbi:hypothetical protein KUCAC02_015541 [Chaenocephalus aceratus]|uniref:Uncharacterized protein n=1 Tax=Chaenocephalus aceratus TaxID=36190 RepID=A0ACB9XXS2_CHAAC|nr:hypothetical protein KUCAC02_015541 [Chaenocephalus aceratus]
MISCDVVEQDVVTADVLSVTGAYCGRGRDSRRSGVSEPPDSVAINPQITSLRLSSSPYPQDTYLPFQTGRPSGRTRKSVRHGRDDRVQRRRRPAQGADLAELSHSEEEGDLADIKSSLVNESESSPNSNSHDLRNETVQMSQDSYHEKHRDHMEEAKLQDLYNKGHQYQGLPGLHLSV